MKEYADGTSVLVTSPCVDRQYTSKVPLFALTGEVVTDIDYGDEELCTLKMEKRYDAREHSFFNDILVYFPLLDFCYWLAEGEYEVA